MDIKDLFRRKSPVQQAKKAAETQSDLAEITLRTIHDGIIITDRNGVIQSINPAAVTMTECGSADHAIGLGYELVIKIETKEGRALSDAENPLIRAMQAGRPLAPTQVALISAKFEKRIPIAISMIPTENTAQNRIITFRDITSDLEAEGEQTEFISTASHEMRTPVATIDGYLSLALNPQTATIDERARGYLTAASNASKHLGKLFQDLLDVTKLDDGRIRPHFKPVEMISTVKSIADDYAARARESKINFSFGSSSPDHFGDSHRMSQVVYSSVDIDFLREILDNLIENALKYTPAGGSIYVNVRGDGDRTLINVTDTGIGISADDLTHIFQKFYRVDNSDTREVGGTGLGLYLVKQRAEAMGGRVWAESAFGEGSTFFVSLPRLTDAEYEKQMIAVRNQVLQPQPAAPAPLASASQPAFSVQPIAAPQPAIPTSLSTPPTQPAVASSSTVTSPVAAQPVPVSPSSVQPAVASQPTPQPTPQLTIPTQPNVAPASSAPQPTVVTAQLPIISQPTPVQPPGNTIPAPPVATPQPAQNQINNNLNGDIK